SHIFCTDDQLADELASLLQFVLRVLRTFGLTEFEAELATRPEKFVGDPAEWDAATDALRFAIESAGLPYTVAEGEGAFYAPETAGGDLPPWLAPVQVLVLPVRNDQDAYAMRLADRLKGDGFRVQWEAADEPLGARIRRAKLQKLPYILVVGDEDVEAGTAGV